MQIKSNSPLQVIPEDYCPKNTDNWFIIPSGLDKGKTLFYSDYCVGDCSDCPVILFVHGNPECSYTYRHIRDQLIAANKPMRIVAMDHIGFGLSDQASFEMVDMHHAANLSQLIKHLDLRNVTLVIHDWGGPIGVGALLQQAERVSRLVVMNTTVFPMPEQGLTYANYPISWLPWCRTPKVVPDSLWGGVAGYVVSHGSPQSNSRFLFNVARYLLLHGLKLFKENTPEYVWSQMLRSKRNAKSSKRNVLQTPY